MKLKKTFFFLFAFLLQSCQEKQSTIVGMWQYERMERTDLQSDSDTLQIAMMEAVYRGSVLQFFDDARFVMSKKDSVTNFEGKGTYEMDKRKKVLSMEGNVRNKEQSRMSVQVFELSDDSLKIGSPEEVFIYSRIKE